MDTKGDHKIECDDFRWGLLDYGVQISKEEAEECQKCFDNDGKINFVEFINQLKVSIYLYHILTFYFIGKLQLE